MIKDRIKWIDIAKFFGMILIYLGHFSKIGRYRSFIFLFHVPLFFFISGCNENYDKEDNYLKYVYKNFKKILVPFIIFALLSIGLYIILYNPNGNDLKMVFVYFLNGCVRNTFISHGLWFLSCLFVMKIIFKIIKYTNNKIIILLISSFLYILAIILRFNNPSLFFNIDSAIYYLIYYCLGYISFDFIKKLFSLDTRNKKIFYWLSGIICLLYALMLLMNKDLIISLPLTNFGGLLLKFVKIIILIYCVLFISKIFENVTIFSKIGQNSIYLCGNEYFVKRLLPLALAVFGIKLYVNGIVSTMIYSIILIILSYVLSIFEKKVIAKVKKIINVNLKKNI